MSGTSYTGQSGQGHSAGADAGRQAGVSADDGLQQAKGATEDLRKGVNGFFDEMIQPSAARDADAGCTAQHSSATTRDEKPTDNLYTRATAGSDFTSHAGPRTGAEERTGPLGGTAFDPNMGVATSETGAGGRVVREGDGGGESGGFSADAKNLGKDLMSAVKGSKNMN